jgi:hypothetical protein
VAPMVLMGEGLGTMPWDEAPMPWDAAEPGSPGNESDDSSNSGDSSHSSEWHSSGGSDGGDSGYSFDEWHVDSTRDQDAEWLQPPSPMSTTLSEPSEPSESTADGSWAEPAGCEWGAPAGGSLRASEAGLTQELLQQSSQQLQLAGMGQLAAPHSAQRNTAAPGALSAPAPPHRAPTIGMDAMAHFANPAAQQLVPMDSGMTPAASLPFHFNAGAGQGYMVDELVGVKQERQELPMLHQQHQLLHHQRVPPPPQQQQQRRVPPPQQQLVPPPPQEAPQLHAPPQQPQQPQNGANESLEPETQKPSQICPFCKSDDSNPPAHKTRMRRKRDVPRQKQRFGRWWRMVGYDGPPYCQRCSEVFRDHLMRQTPNSAQCSRDNPCDDCARVLECFSRSTDGQLWNRIDERNSKNKAKQREKEKAACKKRGAPTGPDDKSAAHPTAVPNAGPAALAAAATSSSLATAATAATGASSAWPQATCSGNLPLPQGQPSTAPGFSIGVATTGDRGNSDCQQLPSDVMVHVAGKRACHGSTSASRAAFATLGLMSATAAVVGLLSATSSGAVGADTDDAGAGTSLPWYSLSPAKPLPSSDEPPPPPGPPSWAQVTVIGVNDHDVNWPIGTTEAWKNMTGDVSRQSLLPVARQSAATWTTDEKTIWMYGGIGETPAKIKSANDFFSHNPNSMADYGRLNVDGGGFRCDMWQGVYSEEEEEQEEEEGSATGREQQRTLHFKQVVHNADTRVMIRWPLARSMAATWLDTENRPVLFGGFRFYQYGMNDLWRFETDTLRWSLLGGADDYEALPSQMELLAEQARAVDGNRSWPLPRGQAAVSMLPDGTGGFLFGGAVQIAEGGLAAAAAVIYSQVTGNDVGYSSAPLTARSMSDLWYIDAAAISRAEPLAPADSSMMTEYKNDLFAYLGPPIPEYVNDPGVIGQYAPDGALRGVNSDVHDFLSHLDPGGVADLVTEQLWPSARAGHSSWIDPNPMIAKAKPAAPAPAAGAAAGAGGGPGSGGISSSAGRGRFYIFGGVGTSPGPGDSKGVACMLKQDLWRYDPKST